MEPIREWSEAYRIPVIIAFTVSQFILGITSLAVCIVKYGSIWCYTSSILQITCSPIIVVIEVVQSSSSPLAEQLLSCLPPLMKAVMYFILSLIPLINYTQYSISYSVFGLILTLITILEYITDE